VGLSWRHAASLPHEEELFAIQVRADGAAIELVLRGELDLAGAPRLAGALARAMATGAEQIALELGELEFIDGAGVGLIERTGRQLRGRGGELTLRHPTPQVRRVFALWASVAGPGQDRDRPALPSARLSRAEVAAVGR